MKNIFSNTFLPIRFFLWGSALVMLFISSYAFPAILLPAKIIVAIFFVLVLVDILLLNRIKNNFSCSRKTARLFNLGDTNSIEVFIQNNSQLKIKVVVIDEIPIQFQRRDFEFRISLKPNEKQIVKYELRPVKRGAYHFGKIHLYISSFMGLVQRRVSFNEATTVPVYPSILQMKNMEMRAMSKISLFKGIKKLRRIGHSYEFEQIKNYVAGDDYRSINWKATGRRSELMVNQYEDERSQQIYFLLDKSRSMRLPFHEMSLLDYAINTSLVMANIALKKQDRAGLISFSSTMETMIKAEKTPSQLSKILNSLYREKESKTEANYELLYSSLRNAIRVRSLLILFTNFESMYSMERVLPILRKLSRFHLLVVVFFENTELKTFSTEDPKNISDIYLQTIAGKFVNEKEQIVNQLKLYGIQSIQTDPEHLSVNVLNKYLELKSRGMI
ncbi:MAG: DUF58 domain-containing protein [Bacteroidetes bacterium]|nr:DUF58 domain-containing protein [Bacteroidota bacterium]